MIEKKYNVAQWIDLYRSLPKSMSLNPGLDRTSILSFLENNGFRAPEDYIEFLQLSNGATLFDGKVYIWEIPTDDKKIPEWKSITYMNQEQIKGALFDIDGIFLIAGNYLGDYIGICTKDKDFDIIYISSETGESWNYHTFTDWLDEMWKELID